jgi:pantoate--beta-alanine ligase
VPTMGALHEGHLSLIREARKECDEVVVSLFVNPLQFGPNEDFTRYPRDEQKDAEMMTSAGADVLFAPTVEEFIGRGFTKVHVPGVSELFEGAHRPGHFDGVATIVAKLFNAAQAEIAYFGLKDRQQCAVIEAMVRDLNFPIRLRLMPTIRDDDGLALSSRNAYLSADHRQIASLLNKTIKGVASAILKGKPIGEALRLASETLKVNGFAVDYLALVDPSTFLPVESAASDSVIVVAAKLGTTRLIDNVAISEVIG